MTFSDMLPLLLRGVTDTLYVTLLSTLLSYVIGTPVGVLLYGTAKGGSFRTPRSTRCSA